MFFSVFTMLFFAVSAGAYIDPSAMTYLVQIVAGVVIAAGAAFGFYFRKIRRAMSKKKKAEEEDDDEDDEDEDTGGDYHPASTMDPVYVENSFCMRNPEHNGLEIYFPSIPNEYIRSKMKEQGWRWHRQKGCWYNRENFDSRALAKRITGTDIKG